MQCNFTAITNWLGVAGAFIVGGLALYIAALAVLYSGILSWLFPVLQWSAVGSVVAAGGAVLIAARYVEDYFFCMLDGSSPKESPCAQNKSNLISASYGLAISIELCAAGLAGFILNGDATILIVAIIACVVAVAATLGLLFPFRSCMEVNAPQ